MELIGLDDQTFPTKPLIDQFEVCLVGIMSEKYQKSLFSEVITHQQVAQINSNFIGLCRPWWDLSNEPYLDQFEEFLDEIMRKFINMSLFSVFYDYSPAGDANFLKFRKSR
jgi:hypothetical protein